jgi:hypothetical protein
MLPFCSRIWHQIRCTLASTVTPGQSLVLI